MKGVKIIVIIFLILSACVLSLFSAYLLTKLIERNEIDDLYTVHGMTQSTAPISAMTVYLLYRVCWRDMSPATAYRLFGAAFMLYIFCFFWHSFSAISSTYSLMHIMVVVYVIFIKYKTRSTS